MMMANSSNRSKNFSSRGSRLNRIGATLLAEGRKASRIYSSFLLWFITTDRHGSGQRARHRSQIALVAGLQRAFSNGRLEVKGFLWEVAMPTPTKKAEAPLLGEDHLASNR